MNVILPIKGFAGIPFSELKADPLLIFKNFPFVEEWVYRAPLSYTLISKPLVVSKYIRLIRKLIMTVEVVGDTIVFKDESENQDSTVDGWVQGIIKPSENGKGSNIEAGIVIRNMELNPLNKAEAANAFIIAGQSFIYGFERNYKDTDFNNTVPVE